MLRLKYERLARGWSQVTLAKRTKRRTKHRVPQWVVSLIELGKWHATPADLDALAQVLDVSPPSALLKEVVIEVDDTPDATAPVLSV